jgi:hypothetical protein
MDNRDVKVIIATDCGSTTTKAILIEKVGEEYRLMYRGEAPTTVEAPFEDVTKGVLNSVTETEELSGRRILDGEKIIRPAKDKTGVDIYVSTSSAGGGLQMMVAGAVASMTAESAQRAALGAGAIVMDVLASNDGRLPHEKIERIRQLRPDMVLLSGGTDGGTVSHVVELAEYISAADPKPRFGIGYQLPVIFAGNKDARPNIQKILGEKAALYITDNLRPVLERENLQPARDRIHELFLEHVMAQAPGYKKLMSWTDAPIMPTPAAVGDIMQAIAKKQGIFDTVFNRTVSANLGMSYSISNVLAEAGLDNIMRWVPFDVDEEDIRNRIKNKMIRPTTVPHTLEELKIEQAIAREALRLAFEHHKALAVGLKGVQQQRDISQAFGQSASGMTLIDTTRLNLIVGSGGVLSHSPRRHQAMLMMLDSYQPIYLTKLAVDSIFMMPHLGVLATVHEQAATEVFEKDCLIHLGSAVCVNGVGKQGEKCITFQMKYKSGKTLDGTVNFGDIALIPLEPGDEAEIMITPTKAFDMGVGRGKSNMFKVTGGCVGLALDARGRPLQIAESKSERVAQITKWTKALNAYPKY